MALISVKDVSLGYGQNVIVSGLNLEINEGDFICVVGANGAGKTTFIRGLLGLNRPMAGMIKYKDLEQKYIGYMPQETAIDENFPASVMEIVLSGTLNRRVFSVLYDKTAKKIALKNLRLLKIEKLKDKSFADLSGGQRQKVLLARALSATQKLLILDEPSNNLDAKSKRDLYELIKKINGDGVAVIMVTHDLDHGNLIGNKILSLRDGDVFFGDIEEFVRKVHNE